MNGMPIVPSLLPTVVRQEESAVLNMGGQFIKFEWPELLTVFENKKWHGRL
jgi:hypothetical protein